MGPEPKQDSRKRPRNAIPLYSFTSQENSKQLLYTRACPERPARSTPNRSSVLSHYAMAVQGPTLPSNPPNDPLVKWNSGAENDDRLEKVRI